MKPKVVSLFLILIFIFFSCDTSHSDKDMEDNSEKQMLSVSLSGVLDLRALNNQIRGVDFEVSEQGKPKIKIKDQKKYDVLLVLKKGSGGIPYYVKTKWEKHTDEQTLVFRGDINLKGGREEIRLGEDWYIMGVLGGDYDGEAKSLSFQSRLTPVHHGEDVKMNVPLAFPWTRLEVKKEGAGSAIVRFKPLGSMLHVRLTNNRIGTHVEGTSLNIHSFIFSMRGAFELKKKLLPSVNQGIGEIKWRAQENSHSMTYDTAFDLEAGRASSYLIWVMPNNNDDSHSRMLISGRFPLPLTKITLSGKISGSRIENLQVFTSMRTVKNHTWHMVNASIHRPKIALEYMADYNLGAKGSRLFVSGHGDADGGYYTQSEAKNNNNIPDDYHLPTQYEWAGIAPIYFQNWGAAAHTVEYGTVVKRSRSNELITVHGVTKTYKGEYNNSPGYNPYDPSTYSKLGVCYALRFQDSENEQLSAWRYSYEDNPFSANGGKCVVIKQCYLGPSFVGNLDDISTEEFWQTHQKEVVTRFLALGGEKDPASGQVEHRGETGFYRSATLYGETSWIFHLTSQSTNTYTPEGSSNREGYFVRPFHND